MTKSNIIKASVLALAFAGILSLSQVTLAKEVQPNDQRGKEEEINDIHKENEINDDRRGHHELLIKENELREKVNQNEAELNG